MVASLLIDALVAMLGLLGSYMAGYNLYLVFRGPIPHPVWPLHFIVADVFRLIAGIALLIGALFWFSI